MRIPIAITRGLAAVAMGGLMLLAVLGFRAQEQDMQNLSEYSQEVIYWSTAQAEAEHGRFLAALGLFAIGDPDVTAADVNRRFDILWSRVALFRQGDVGRRIREYDGDLNAIALNFDTLVKHEQAVVALSHDDPAELHQRILADFAEAGAQLRALSVLVLAGEERRLAGARDAVRASARLTWMFSMAALALSLLLMGIMLIETRRYRRMAEESALLANRAEAASRAKSRFLTMMSHELRTPMNGVLGLLALAKQTSLNERQVRLIDQAERSGRQMSALLGDILDFSDLQSDSLTISQDPFTLGELADAVQENFGPIIQREGVRFALEIDHAALQRGAGDLQRLRQVLGHFLTFLIDVVGSRDVVLRLKWDTLGFVAEVDAAVRGRDEPGWQPEAMFGRSGAAYDDFASDSLGPMIARGLLELMGGSAALDRPCEERAILTVAVPMVLTRASTDCVRVAAQTVTIQAILGALLRKMQRPVCERAEANCHVAAVLLEAGGDDELMQFAALRAEHPAAQMIAVGMPSRSELFDAVVAQPITQGELESALSQTGKTRSKTG